MFQNVQKVKQGGGYIEKKQAIPNRMGLWKRLYDFRWRNTTRRIKKGGKKMEEKTIAELFYEDLKDDGMRP